MEGGFVATSDLDILNVTLGNQGTSQCLPSTQTEKCEPGNSN